jgi:tetratricopeptide (TPR) repeat protein
VRITYDADYDLLIAVEFGETIDNHLEDEYEQPVAGFTIFRRGPDGPVIGFGIEPAYEFELPDPDEPLMPGYRFDAPTLGIHEGSAEEILLAARVILDRGSTPDVVFYDEAVAVGASGDDEEAEQWWRLCLAAGEPKGHYGLGYTLAALDRPREAYGHLREYTRVVPRNAWAWAWFGHVSADVGEQVQAFRCYERALELEREGSPETDAGEHLAKLRRSRRRAAKRRR